MDTGFRLSSRATQLYTGSMVAIGIEAAALLVGVLTFALVLFDQLQKLGDRDDLILEYLSIAVRAANDVRRNVEQWEKASGTPQTLWGAPAIPITLKWMQRTLAPLGLPRSFDLRGRQALIDLSDIANDLGNWESFRKPSQWAKQGQQLTNSIDGCTKVLERRLSPLGRRRYKRGSIRGSGGGSIKSGAEPARQ